jgi:anthranilate phosphoribosyltransferase
MCIRDSRTIFNILGPLCNPAEVSYQVVGVFDPALVEPLAGVLGVLGSQRAFVVCGVGNVDEVTPAGPVRVAEYADG